MGDRKREITEPRRLRVDAQQNVGSLLKAAMEVLAISGVDAPVREIAEKAGVGLGNGLTGISHNELTLSRPCCAGRRSMRVRTLHHALRLSIDPLKLWKDGCSVTR